MMNSPHYQQQQQRTEQSPRSIPSSQSHSPPSRPQSTQPSPSSYTKSPASSPLKSTAKSPYSRRNNEHNLLEKVVIDTLGIGKQHFQVTITSSTIILRLSCGYISYASADHKNNQSIYRNVFILIGIKY